MQQLIAIRLDPPGCSTNSKGIKRRNVDYQTLINKALATHVKHVA